jgi:hypothetical protein
MIMPSGEANRPSQAIGAEAQAGTVVQSQPHPDVLPGIVAFQRFHQLSICCLRPHTMNAE